jgi:uncharacterized 2Fe-2S/4Fe-4S cluster protein (DUF4445 family)
MLAGDRKIMDQAVVFQPSGHRVEADPVRNLLDLALTAGVDLEGTCGGKGVCGKCLVKPQGQAPAPDSREAELLGEQAQDGYRLACRTLLPQGGSVWVPPESLRQEQIILTEGLEVTLGMDPVVKALELSLPPATLQDPASAENRLQNTLQVQPGFSGDPLAHTPLSLLQALPAALAKEEGRISVSLRAPGEVTALGPGWGADCLGLAVDLGTTTVVAYLMDLKTNRPLAVTAAMNPQVQRGDDVIARISYCAREADGLAKLGEMVAQCVNQLAAKACEEAGRSPADIVECVMVGNTAMHHIALGLDPASLALAPYAPAVSDALDCKARRAGLNFAPEAWLHWLPVKAGFVGADLVAVTLAVEQSLTDEPTLILDLGTNGEMALSARGKLACCSTAAGPAFEGAHITCGMRGAPGAVDQARLDPATLDPELRVIADTKPKGLCGSGLVSLISELLAAGAILTAGSFNTEIANDRLREGPHGLEYVFAFGADSALGRDLVLSSRDVAELQLAKGAIQAGARILMAELGVDKLARVVLAGAFGNYLSPSDACAIGLFPGVSQGRVEGVGNAAGAGAVMALTSRGHRSRAAELAQKMQYLELSSHSLFPDYFVEGMLFESPA